MSTAIGLFGILPLLLGFLRTTNSLNRMPQTLKRFNTNPTRLVLNTIHATLVKVRGDGEFVQNEPDVFHTIGCIQYSLSGRWTFPYLTPFKRAYKNFKFSCGGTKVGFL
jgi:hypothetical protein